MPEPIHGDQSIAGSLGEVRLAQSQLATAVDALTAAIELQQPSLNPDPASNAHPGSTRENLDGAEVLPQAPVSAQKTGFTSRIVLTYVSSS